MPWTTWRFPSNTAEQESGELWSSPARVTADDGSFSEVSAISGYLMMSGCGFVSGDMPSDSIIVAVEIEAEIKGYTTSGSGTLTYEVGLHEDPSLPPDTAGQKTGTYTVTSTTLVGATSDYPVFSGLFGVTLAARADVTSASFGPWIQFQNSSTAGGKLAVDYVKVRVLYERPGGHMIGDM